MKLKTINELINHTGYIDPEYLKEEAVKWVKKGDKKLKKKIVIDWHGAFMDFFNLTEDDLK